MQRTYTIILIENQDKASASSHAVTLRECLSDVLRTWRFISLPDLQQALELIKGELEVDGVVLDFSVENALQVFAQNVDGGFLDLLNASNIALLGIYETDHYPVEISHLALEIGMNFIELVSWEQLLTDPGSLAGALSACLRKAGRAENREALLITHGTDTMAWAFAYLRYALSSLRLNIALTGSQLPLEGTFSLSDALGNLRTSVYMLNRLAPARLFMVFNEGRHVYAGSLNKIRKWDQNAFDGRLVGAIGAEAVDFFDQDWVSIVYPDQRLEKLHLIRTGGTIESAASGGGPLAPGADFVHKYLLDSLSNQFVELVDHTELQISRDSSNISIEEWRQLAGLVAQISGSAVDDRFDPTVKVIYANPFMTTYDYIQQFESCNQGIILAGYGAGNANTLESSGRSVLPAIRHATRQGKLVALSSQVPLESYDMDYQVGRELVQAGGLPCGDLSLADAQVKVSYLVGHRQEIESAAAANGLDTMQLLTAAFLAGVRLRKKGSRVWLAEELARQGRPVRFFAAREAIKDPFEGKGFQEGIREVIGLLRLDTKA